METPQELKMPSLLKVYKSAEFSIQLRSLFIYKLIIALIILLTFICITTSYLEYSNPIINSVDFFNLSAEILLLSFFIIALLSLKKGYYELATHLVMVSTMVCIWSVMWFGHGQNSIPGRLNIIVYVIALLNMSPLFISRFRKNIFFYISANIVLCICFISFHPSMQSLHLNVKTDILINWISSTLLCAIIGYNINSIHKRTLQTALKEIEERKKTELALMESDLFRQRVFDSSKIPIVVMDAKTLSFIDCNFAAIEIYQFKSKENTIGKKPLDVSATFQYTGQRSDKLIKVYLTKAQKLGGISFDWLHCREDGQLWDAEVHLLYFESDDQSFYQFSIIDVTEKKKAEKERSKSEEKYRFLLDNMNEVVIMVDNDDRVEYVNKKFTEVLGYSENEIIGQIGNTILLSEEDRKLIIEQNKNRIKKESNRYEISFNSKDGRKIYFIINGTPIYDENGITVGSIGTMTDVTEKKQIELQLDTYLQNLEIIVRERTDEVESINEELIAINEELITQKNALENALNQLQTTKSQLVQSEKMASLGILAAGIAHEINNPLNFINGGIMGLEIYLEEYLNISQYEEIKPLIEAINTGVKRSTDIVTSLSLYSRKDDLKREGCSIHKILESCLTILNNQLIHKVNINRKYTTSSDVIVGNQSKLHQAFMNIIFNASQSIHQKGEINIETYSENDSFSITISDTGCGISTENLAKIFDPFFTTKDPGEGVGLGLSITYNIIQEHKGSIVYESKINDGTKVKLSFPIL